MALTIRLRQQGRTGHQQYRLVVMDSRVQRDGKYVEMIGWYDPRQEKEENRLFIKTDRVQYWLGKGATLSDKAAALVRHTSPEVLRAQTEQAVAKKRKEQLKRRERRTAAKKAVEAKPAEKKAPAAKKAPAKKAPAKKKAAE